MVPLKLTMKRFVGGGLLHRHQRLQTHVEKSNGTANLPAYSARKRHTLGMGESAALGRRAPTHDNPLQGELTIFELSQVARLLKNDHKQICVVTLQSNNKGTANAMVRPG